HYPTTVPRFNSIYTYSDFTGSLRDMFSDPMGTYSKRYECGPMEVGVWGDLTWDTTVPAMPPGMEIVIMVRVGSTIPELDAATAHEIARIRMTDPEQGMTNIATELEAFIGAMASRRRYLEVQFLLVRPAGETLSPVVHDFNLDWRCVPVF
ncbi:MAG: hypothetical protein IT379_15685, partial [Deltaproteobacteria bacterium]|nr:hypothetical protein [Deltaproteobacteria bacterium]